MKYQKNIIIWKIIFIQVKFYTYIKITDDLVVVYKGLSSDIAVKEGDTVKKGQEIGKATSMLTEKADGVHLHLELLEKNKLVDPTDYFSFSK